MHVLCSYVLDKYNNNGGLQDYIFTVFIFYVSLKWTKNWYGMNNAAFLVIFMGQCDHMHLSVHETIPEQPQKNFPICSKLQ